MNEAMYNLYAITKDKDHLTMATYVSQMKDK